MTERRVVVTGIGLVSPLGIGVEDTWAALVQGKSGIGPITLFDTTDFATKFAGEVKSFDPLQFVHDKREAKWMDRFLHFGYAAARLAIEDSGIVVTEENAERIGAYIGSGLSGVATIERTHAALKEKGPRRGISPYFVPAIIVNMSPGLVTIHWGMKGPNMSHVSACSTGAHSIGEAMRGSSSAAMPTPWSRAAPRPRSRRSAWAASTPCARCRPATRRPSRQADPGMSIATAS